MQLKELPMYKIKKIVVANRGEIALRVMRTAREMGIRTVAVYSEPDRMAPHALFADEARHIGPASAADSYLNMEKIIQVAKDTQADAIHPGYGFLSENATFAQKVADAGIVFIGPSPQAIQLMGDKITSKQTVAAFDVPLIPGMQEPITDVAEAMTISKEIGYPVMIKASAGGGGKGMRVVNDPEEFEEQMERAMSEARNSFSNDAVFIEKFITNPKHIEVQILGDQHGNYVYLFERDCSIQRRNQKVIEEAPSAVMNEAHRKKIGEAAVNVARACNYYGAGTVEFVANENLDFYFLEMNTRLQVEHPVTEEITGKDLVREQIRIAEGHPIAFKQEDLEIRGHSIEIRVYAEDATSGFLPDTGMLRRYEVPKGPGIRVDDGLKEGLEVSVHYDPMIAKLVATASDRDAAIERMIRAIDEYRISGIQTTLEFCRFALNHPEFRSGKHNTKFVEKFFEPDMLNRTPADGEIKMMAAIAAQVSQTNGKSLDNEASSTSPTKPNSSWKLRQKT